MPENIETSFSYAEAHAIRVPGDFWDFWRDFYDRSSEERRALKRRSFFASYNRQLWDIFDHARNEIELEIA